MGLLGKSVTTGVVGNVLKTKGIKSLATAGMAATFSAPVLFSGAINKIGSVAKMIKNIASPQVMTYGKRGIGSNRLSSNNLVQNLHKNRRR